ncbi:unnamed protein product, partial [Rotaria sordida]
TFATWEVRREDEFSPLKNGAGNKDTAETCRRDLILQHIRYLKQVGTLLQKTNENICEISCFLCRRKIINNNNNNNNNNMQ